MPRFDVAPTRVTGKVRLAGESDRIRVMVAPVPVRVTTWEPWGVLSFTVTVAVRTPDAVGWKDSVTVQEPPETKAPTGQELPVIPKSPGLAPASAGAARVAVPVPRLLRVNEPVAVPPTGVAEKTTSVVDCDITWVAVCPVPSNGTLCGLPGALSLI